jgi:hypothetical protein
MRLHEHEDFAAFVTAAAAEGDLAGPSFKGGTSQPKG